MDSRKLPSRDIEGPKTYRSVFNVSKYRRPNYASDSHLSRLVPIHVATSVTVGVGRSYRTIAGVVMGFEEAHLIFDNADFLLWYDSV